MASDKTSPDPEWPTLRFRDPAREEAFLLWLVPRPRWSNTILMAVATIVSILYMVSIGGFGNGTQYYTVLLLTHLLFVLLSLVDAICVAWSRILGAGSKFNMRLIKSTDVIFCSYIVTLMVMEIAVIQYFVSQSCADDNVLYADNQKMYREANCFRRFTTGATPMLTFLPLKRIRFVNSLVTAVVATTAMTITLAVWPHRYLALTIGHVVVMAALLVFISFVHYLIERDARKYFATRERLHAYTEDVQARADALEAYVANLLPPELLARSSRKIAADKHDVSDSAVVLVLGVPDFTAHSTSWVPVDLVLVIESAHNLLYTELQQSPLQRVSVVLDEVVAVGNLLRSDNVARCVVQACSVASRSLSAITRNTNLPQHAALDVGPATGGFLGTTHVRYDVWGEAVRTARTAINFAASTELVLTDSARHVAQSALVVREGPTMENVVEGATNESQELWIFCSCDSLAFAEEEGLVLALQSEGESSSTGHSHTASSQTQFDATKSLESSKLGVLARAVRLAGEVKSSGSKESKFGMKSTWIAYKTFSCLNTEAAFVEQRQRTMLARAGRMWLGYAALVIVLMAVLVADLDEHRGGAAVIIMTLAALLSVAVALAAGRIGENSPGKHTVWCVASLLVPLLTIYAGAVGRPSALGNDMRHLLIIGAIVRGPSFRHARHQLVVVPILAVVFHMHLLLPGAIFQLPSLLYVSIVFFVMVTDQENDMSQRHNFIAEQEIKSRLNQLEREENVRKGLVLTAVPMVLVERFARLGPGAMLTTVQPETAVVLVSRRPVVNLDGSVSGTSSRVSKDVKSLVNPTLDVEGAANQCPSLTIVKLFGDNVLLINPIGGRDGFDGHVAVDDELQRNCDILRLFSLLRQRDPSGYQMITEVDTTTQLLEQAGGLPSFKVMGTAVSRVVAIGSSGAAMLPGVLLTERAQKAMSLSGALQSSEGGLWIERPLPSWRVRGIGMVRLVQLDVSEVTA